jgi:hypothetical protein
MNNLDKRYWERIGMYVTKDFAYEWADKIKEAGSKTGKYFDDDIEEYVEGSQPTPNQLIREIDNLFEAEYFEAEISDDIDAILQLTQMERDKVNIIKNLMSEHMANGLDKKEARDLAKEEYESTISQKVAEILDISPEQSMFELPEGYDNWQDWEADRKEREEREQLAAEAEADATPTLEVAADGREEEEEE